MSEEREGKRYFWTPRLRWEDNTEMCRKKTGFEGVDRVQLQRAVMNIHVLQNAENS
jgi:hypothetical protein